MKLAGWLMLTGFSTHEVTQTHTLCPEALFRTQVKDGSLLHLLSSPGDKGKKEVQGKEFVFKEVIRKWAHISLTFYW